MGTRRRCGRRIGFRGLVAGVTADRGRSWRRVVIADLVPFTSQLGDGFGGADTRADLLLQIGDDERMQRLEGLRRTAVAAPRPTTS
jgi:hypothetical protein